MCVCATKRVIGHVRYVSRFWLYNFSTVEYQWHKLQFVEGSHYELEVRVRITVFNATFNNISIIL